MEIASVSNSNHTTLLRPAVRSRTPLFVTKAAPQTPEVPSKIDNLTNTRKGITWHISWIAILLVLKSYFVTWIPPLTSAASLEMGSQLLSMKICHRRSQWGRGPEGELIIQNCNTTTGASWRHTCPPPPPHKETNLRTNAHVLSHQTPISNVLNGVNTTMRQIMST